MSAAFAATPAGAGTAPVTPMAQETQALKVAQVAQVAQATQAALPTPAMQRTPPPPAPAGRWTLMRP
ncbi:MAG TPA: malonyl-CoA decarboxylase, partial [Quisquiliibacterium sp.]|nr:malonyl-CoA decarboxylase [Quisquiliibacterium sp.]